MDRAGLRTSRRGVALVAVIVLLLVVGLIILGMVLSGARDQTLTAVRIDTVQAFYGAEAGVNMAVREMAVAADEDGDGGIGTISDDSNDATDPSVGAARVVVTTAGAPFQITMTSRGRAGRAQRTIAALTK